MLKNYLDATMPNQQLSSVTEANFIGAPEKVQRLDLMIVDYFIIKNIRNGK